MGVFFPQSNLGRESIDWGRSVESAITSIESENVFLRQKVSEFDYLHNDTSNSLAGVIASLQAEIALERRLSETLSTATVIDRSNFTGWYDTNRDLLPKVLTASPTGLLYINFGGGVKGGMGAFALSIRNAVTSEVYLDRSVVFSDEATVLRLNGSNPAVTGMMSTVCIVPPNESILVVLEIYAYNSSTVFTAGKLITRGVRSA